MFQLGSSSNGKSSNANALRSGSENKSVTYTTAHGNIKDSTANKGKQDSSILTQSIDVKNTNQNTRKTETKPRAKIKRNIFNMNQTDADRPSRRDSSSSYTSTSSTDSAGVHVPGSGKPQPTMTNSSDELSSGLEKEYSADIRPLKFKMNKSPMTSSSAEMGKRAQRSHYAMHEALFKPGYNGSPNSSVHSPMGNNIISYPWSYNFIDKQQFTGYLEQPKYIKVFHKRKNIGAFKRLFLAQELHTDENNATISLESGPHQGRPLNPRLSVASASAATTSVGNRKAVWTIKFSINGKYMSTGNKDGSVRIWKVISSPVERWELDTVEDAQNLMKVKTQALKKPRASTSSIDPHDRNLGAGSTYVDGVDATDKSESTNLYAPVFNPKPVRTYREHTQDVLETDWSKNDFLLTASMDKTVKLWHPAKKASLGNVSPSRFCHFGAVPSSRRQVFVSTCLDHKCRLWSIVDSELCFEFDCQDLITSLAVSEDGAYTFVGTFNGFIHILATNPLKCLTSFHIKDRNTQGIHSKPVGSGGEAGSKKGKEHRGPRVTGIECFSVNGNTANRKLLITSNDSRIRVFDMNTRKVIEYLKGLHSASSQHIAQFVPWNNKPVVVCSSDNHWIYAWELMSEEFQLKPDLGSVNLEESIRGQPSMEQILKQEEIFDREKHPKGKNKPRIPFFHNPFKLLSNNSSNADVTAKKNSKYASFHAHHRPVTNVVVAPVATAKTLSLSNDFICELTLQFIKEATMGDTESASTVSSSTRSLGKKKNKENATDSVKISPKRSVPDVVHAIGPIIVSSDNNGTIRVFRVDMSKKIRLDILKQMKEIEKLPNTLDKKEAPSYFDDALVGQCLNNSSGRTHAESPLHHVENRSSTEYDSTTPKGKTSRSGTSARNNLFSRSQNSLVSVRSTGKSGSVVMDETNALLNTKIAPAGSTRNTRTIDSLGTLRLRCDVCNGTKFERLRRNSLGQRELGYYCVDCGTLLNNFR
ncbi:Dgr2p KNAG_0A06340 [Huiozyma naganishii CBS 8797]|uniref:Uncharacterized protein n=1 Tax=Huiozyma naganishii (strain ATCC MYA-139 / BCRC 22969 / CBS 8797 / KCTC 17520 / NBRC 10181 / NCYC 3082 / Yp74L-3) TaxID=1071383 RepID=J7S2P7_HUIN7|nr:hypothetical protein KNAG_0A06340 [Kazachstania naganishii CBS 8797]CCK68294.1 hypothetical protein KNAG_0A06340 [Kazachstania naganishii CBS 8797]